MRIKHIDPSVIVRQCSTLIELTTAKSSTNRLGKERQGPTKLGVELAIVWLAGGAARRLSKRVHATGCNGLLQVLAHRHARIRLVAPCRDTLARAMAHAGPAKIGESNHSNAQSRWLCVRELRTFTCHSLKPPVDTHSPL